MGLTTEFQESHNVQTRTSKLMSGPIAPGQSFTYRWRATRYGTTWYHSHFSLQYSEGLLGPIIIQGPTIENWDIDLGTVLLQDWYHTPVFEVWFTELQKPPVPADNGLINGKNKNGSIGEYSEFVFKPGKKYRMRVINTSTDGQFKFSIDQHTMIVQAADFIAVQPYAQTVLNVAIGIPNINWWLIQANDMTSFSRQIKRLETTGCERSLQRAAQ